MTSNRRMTPEARAQVLATAQREVDSLVSAAYAASAPDAPTTAALAYRDALAHAVGCGHVDWLLGALDQRLTGKGRALHGDAWSEALREQTIGRAATRVGLRAGPTPWVTEAITRYAFALAYLERALVGGDGCTPAGDDAVIVELEAEFE